MNPHVSFNLQISASAKSFINAISPAALYGRGVFTTVAIHGKKPFLWEKHWRRLEENAARVGIDLSGFGKKSVESAILKLIALDNIKTGRARISFFDEKPGKIWSFDSPHKTSLLITTADFQIVEESFQLTVSPFQLNSKSPLANVKSCNYMENLLALEEAKKRGFDEAIRLNERGEIASASMSNVFWMKDERIFTPPIESGCLAGTTRALLLENFAVEEKSVSLEELFEAEEVFLTSSGIGIKSVAKIDEKSFENKFTEKLQKFYSEQTAKI